MDPEWRHRAGVNKSKRTGKVSNDEKADWTQTWELFPGRIAYVWHGALHATTVAESLEIGQCRSALAAKQRGQDLLGPNQGDIDLWVGENQGDIRFNWLRPGTLGLRNGQND